MGMADGRCFTIHSSAQLYNDFVMKQNGISYEDNYAYRKLLQSKGPELFAAAVPEGCGQCLAPLLNLSDTY
jgi:hypothetical protein